MNSIKKIFMVAILFLLLSSLSSAKDYSYNEFDVDASVQKNSVILVKEKLTVHFRDEFTYGHRYFETYNIDDVTDFRVTDLSTGRLCRIKDRSRSGGKISYEWDMSAYHEVKTFLLEYKITGAIKSTDSGMDKLYYTPVFRDREKNVEKAVFTLHFPERVDINRMNIKTNIPADYEQTDDYTLQFNTVNVAPHTPFDVEILFPEGMVDIPFDWRNLIQYLLVAFIVILFLYISFTTASLVHREYKAYGRDPDVVVGDVRNLRPAIAGTVVDEKADIKEVISTIIDLAVRGYIHIKEDTDKILFFKKKKIHLINMHKKQDRLLGYEKKVIENVFDSGDEIQVSSLRNKFYKKIPKITKEIFKEATTQGLFPENPKEVIRKYRWEFAMKPTVFIIMAFIVVLLSVSFSFEVLTLVTIVLALLMGLLVISFEIVAGHMPRKTVSGVMGQKKYLKLKKFMEDYPLTEGRLFDEYLPYAIAFGIQDVWMKKLDDLMKHTEYHSTWYSGHLTSSSFISLNRSLSASMAPPSSSGGGGGGFGGGGGAGGGGGGFG